MMSRTEVLTDAELLARLGIPPDCPHDVAHATVRAMAGRWTREGIEAVRAASREQAESSPMRKTDV